VVSGRKYVRSLGKGHPEDKDELEGVVEGCPVSYRTIRYVRSELTEPVDGVDGALEDGQERIDDPVCEPLLHISILFESVLHRVARTWVSSTLLVLNRALSE
jgi:hypothetical protein